MILGFPLSVPLQIASITSVPSLSFRCALLAISVLVADWLALGCKDISVLLVSRNYNSSRCCESSCSQLVVVLQDAMAHEDQDGANTRSLFEQTGLSQAHPALPQGFIARGVFHLLMGKPPRRTAANRCIPSRSARLTSEPASASPRGYRVGSITDDRSRPEAQPTGCRGLDDL